ncbi:MAG: NAD-dependent epimerase/dehydratase family protein [Reichenbachiella sp.]
MKTILVIGASGQLGSVLVQELHKMYGMDRVIASDLRFDPSFQGRFIGFDATDFDKMIKVVEENHVNEIYHMAAILSASGEEFPLNTWDINMKSFFNVLEAARLCNVKKVFFPSSIAVFGEGVKRLKTPQNSPLIPTTVYGMSKVAGENWANYYYKKYNLDVRSLRYPGIIGHQSMPGGGTTDYAIDIFHKAVKHEPFKCFLESTTALPMMYMEDCIRATIELMHAPIENIAIRTSYNLAGVSFSPKQLASAIKRVIPKFEIKYDPDFRQEIAENWPMSIDDTQAKNDWKWKPKYNLEMITKIMIKELEKKYKNELVHH